MPNRRQFLQTSGLALGASALPLAGAAAPHKPSATSASRTNDVAWRYSMCNETMMGRPWAEQCEVIQKAGYTGVEIAPFTLVQDYGVTSVRDFTAEQRREFKQVMDDHGLDCVGLHWLLTPPPEGLHFTTPDDAVRERSVDYLRALIDFSADLGGPYLIFGSPGQRSTTGGASVEDAMRYFVEGLAAVADQAAERGAMVLVEHLSPDQTDVVTLMSEAQWIVEQVGRPEAVNAMFDFHNSVAETEPLPEVIETYYPYIHHIQVQEMDGQYLGTGNAVNDYIPAFQKFKDLGYDKWVSLEIFDFDPPDEVIADVSMAVLKKIESELT